MIIFDTEGTELIKPDVAPLVDQPHLVEFAGIKVDADTLEEQERLQFYCKPDIALPELFTKITGITEDTIKDAKTFSYNYIKLCNFFLGETHMFAHNMGYDSSILKFALMRIDRLLNFPWPMHHRCTVEISQGIKGHRLSLSDLHMMAAGKTPEQRLAFFPGQFLKHKTLGKCTVLEVGEERLAVKLENGKEKKLLKEMFKGAAFEAAHGAMKDCEELLTIVRWLRKEGHL